MADKMRYYNVDDYNKQRRQQGFRLPPEANFHAAANHVRDIFENKKLAYAVMGGLEMLCLGHRRPMPDIHIAYDDRDFARIKAKLESDQRVRLPDGMNPLFPSKILVRTGPAYKDKGCSDTAVVEVNLIPPGTHGAPPMGMLNANLVLLTLKPDGKLKTYKGLNMLHLIKSLLHYCSVSDLAWNPKKDVLFLCKNYRADVQSIRERLDRKAVQQNFLGTAFFSKFTLEDRRVCYHTLLGQEPPPLMAITPPPHEGHRHSHSASEMPRPRVVSHQSSSSVNQQSFSELSSHPPLSKVGASTKNPTSTASLAAELSALPDSTSNLPAQISPPSELPASTRDSRSRYRPVSAPNSRNISPQGSEMPNSLRPRSMDMRHAPQKSMPNMNMAFQGSVAPLTFAKASSMTGSSPFPPHLQQFKDMPVEMSATPVPYNPGQEHMKSQLGLGGDYLNPLLRAQNQRPITNNPIPPNPRIAHEGPRTARLEQSGVSGLQSQKGSLHIVSPDDNAAPLQQSAPSLAEVTGPLRLVGPEGLFQTPPKPSPPVQDNMSGMKADMPSAFELDATHIVAELSADIDAALKLSQTTQPHAYKKRMTDGSPVDPLEPHAAPTISHPDILAPGRPLAQRTQSAPLAGLPTSLMAGGPSSRQNQYKSSSSVLSSSPPQIAPAEMPVAISNASRYSQYSFPPSSTPNSYGTSPPLGLTSTSQYKAYQPPSVHSLSSDAKQATNVAVEQRERSSSFEALKDIDGANRYLRSHKRDASHDSHTSTGSHDSTKLAQEYQAELPGFDQGYNASKDAIGQ